MTNSNKAKIDAAAIAILLPSIIALAIIPVLMRATIVVSTLEETYRYFSGTYNSSTGEYYFVDVYSQCKAFAVVLFAVIMLVLAAICCIRLFKNTEKRNLIFVGASAVYVVMSLFSAIGSKYGDVAFFGQFDRAEGFFTTACYFVLFLYTMYAFRTTQNFRYILYALFVCVGVNFIIGAFQFSGNNLIFQEWFRKIIVDPEYADILQLNPDGVSGSMYGALYHYNYVGSFCGLTVPLLTVVTLFAEKIWQKAVCAVFDILAFLLLFGSSARSGIVAIAAAFVVGIVVFFRLIIRHWKPAVIVAASAAVLFVGANFAAGGALFRRIPSIITDSLALILPAEDQTDLFSTMPIKEINVNDDGTVSFTTQQDKLNVAFDSDNMSYLFTDSSGAALEPVANEEGENTFTDSRFQGITLYFASLNGEEASYNDIMFLWFTEKNSTYLTFQVFDGQIKMVHPKTDVIITPVNAEAIGFKGKEKLGSSRGYIWSRTIPLLKNCIITGYGADTFAYNFPQTDFLAKYYSYAEGFNITVDKPHNLYIQIFHDNGLIALLAFLLICGLYIVDCFRLYAFKKEYGAGQIYGTAVMLGIVGYLAAGVFNDSVVSVAPAFWILLGVGGSLNIINRREYKKEAAREEKTAPAATSSSPVSSPAPVKNVNPEEEHLRDIERQAQDIVRSIRSAPVQISDENKSQIRQEDIADLASKANEMLSKMKAEEKAQLNINTDDQQSSDDSM